MWPQNPLVSPRRSWISIIESFEANLTPCRSTIELKDDTLIVVLGASGDLAKKKTVLAPVPWLFEPTLTTCLDSSQRYSAS